MSVNASEADDRYGYMRGMYQRSTVCVTPAKQGWTNRVHMPCGKKYGPSTTMSEMLIFKTRMKKKPRKDILYDTVVGSGKVDYYHVVNNMGLKS